MREGQKMLIRRSCSVVAGVVLSLVGALGLASPADAIYTSEPIARAWTADGAVHSSVAAGSVIYLGGKFNGGGGIVALDSSTGALIWSLPANGDVRAMALSSDGNTLFVGGHFSTVNGQTHRKLAAIDVTGVVTGTPGTVLPDWKASASGPVRDLVVTGDTLFVGGHFTKINGLTQRGLGAIIASTGQPLPGFTTYVNAHVYGLALTSTHLVFSGSFTLVNGNQPRSSLAAVSLSTFQLSGWAPRRVCTDCDNYWDVVVSGGNAIVAVSGFGGYVNAFSLSSGNTSWRVFADGDVQTLHLASDGLLYIGGHFGEFVGSSNNDRELMAALNPANGSVDPNFHPHFYKKYPGVWTIAETPGMLWGGGDFTGTRQNGRNNRVPFYAAFSS
jgi:hypothetical protein